MAAAQQRPPARVLSPAIIKNPANPAHTMAIKPMPGRVRVLRGGQVLAASVDAVQVLEFGRGFYDPRIYLPPGDVAAGLVANQKRTHCPLKGDATYFDLPGRGGEVEVADIAWTYAAPFDFAAALAGRLAFYPQHVVIEMTGQDAP